MHYRVCEFDEDQHLDDKQLREFYHSSPSMMLLSNCRGLYDKTYGLWMRFAS